jgi:hypothetical protein
MRIIYSTVCCVEVRYYDVHFLGVMSYSGLGMVKFDTMMKSYSSLGSTVKFDTMTFTFTKSDVL